MTRNVLTWDLDTARQEGEGFGRLAGQEAASAMTQGNLGAAEAKMLGADAVSAVLAAANRLADAGLPRDLVEAWTESAAEAFNRELERAAALLSVSGTRH